MIYVWIPLVSKDSNFLETVGMYSSFKNRKFLDLIYGYEQK